MIGSILRPRKAGFSGWSTWLATYLLLANPLTASAKCASDYYVHSLPGQPDGPLLKMHAGHIEVDPENNGNLFFWHYQNRHIADKQRTVIWLNGGPGCSSMDGALMEVGPYRLKSDQTLEYNEGSWDEFAHLLFVDNPVGTGFSYVNTDSYLHELDVMAAQFVVFLEHFFEMFPEYEQDELYIAGESYAGQHIPYITKAILDRNKEKQAVGDEHVWNIKGLLIGNGWVSPPEQYESYLSFAYNNGLIQGGTQAAKNVEAQQSKCLSTLNEPGARDQISVQVCEEVLQQILKDSRENDKCYNMYDVRLRDVWPSCGMNWPPDLEFMTPYLRRSDVVSALHVNSEKTTGWTECSGAVSGNFHPHTSKPSVHLLPEILESGVSIVLFSGKEDFICNHEGTEEFIKNMKWSGATGFELSPGVWAPRHDWMFEGEAAGFYQEARNLTYVLFYNSSHMVPFDYPRRTRDMLDRFLGVDISSIGGAPAESLMDGSEGPLTSVGQANSTTEQGDDDVENAKWDAYYRSGEVALVVVIIAACAWGFFIWRSRRQRQGSGYRGIYHDEDGSSGSLSRFRNKRGTNGDIEAADFDEAELDNLPAARGGPSHDSLDSEPEHYAVGEESSDEEDAKNENKAILDSSNEEGAGSSRDLEKS